MGHDLDNPSNRGIGVRGISEFRCGIYLRPKMELRRLENSYLAKDSQRDRETCNLAQ